MRLPPRAAGRGELQTLLPDLSLHGSYALATHPDDRRIPLFVTDSLLRRILAPPTKLVSQFVAPGNSVVDLGCGPGYFTIPMAELVGRDGRVFAVDFDPRAIERLERKKKEKGLAGVIESRTASAADVGFIPDESVDFVLAHGLLCCMTDHVGALRQIERILKREGRAYLSITRRAGRNDPRTVGPEEWKQILERFRVHGSGQSFFSRWALVSRSTGGAGHEDRGGAGERPSSVCCCS